MAAPERQYRIAITPHGKGLRVHVAGQSGIDTTLAYWREIAGAARERKAVSLLLVDELVGTPLGEDDWLRVVTGLQGEGLERLRIAHVKPLGLQQVEFCEIFARDAGIEARVFENEALADIWLKYGER
jgi:hypothetical protein